MATATETPEPAQEEIPEPIPERSDLTKAKRLVFMRHLAHEGVMIAKMVSQIRTAERMQKFAATGDVKDLEAPEGEDEMGGVNIGNENHFHITNPPAQSAPATTTTEPVTPVTTEPVKPEVIRPEIVKPEVVQPVIVPAANGKSSVLPAVLSTVLGVVGAGGIGLGALALWNSYNDKPTVNVSDVDRDWRIGLRVQDHP